MTLLLLVALVGGGFLAWTWAPVYFLHVEVKQVVRDYMNQAVRNPNDAELVQKMTEKLRTLDSQVAPDAHGEPVQAPTVDVDPSAVTWERDAQGDPPTVHVAFEYTRAVPYPLLDRWTEKTMSVDLIGDLTRPDWGPAR